jgi:hypothetical protein
LRPVLDEDSADGRAHEEASEVGAHRFSRCPVGAGSNLTVL